MRSFSGDIIFTPNEYGLIEIHVINKNPEMAADMANYFAHLADSLNIKLNIEQQ
jgi:capsular polysaccharide biosynthesis protein